MTIPWQKVAVPLFATTPVPSCRAAATIHSATFVRPPSYFWEPITLSRTAGLAWLATVVRCELNGLKIPLNDDEAFALVIAAPPATCTS